MQSRARVNLTGRQRAFVEAFAPGGISAKAAAIKAGYSPKSADAKATHLRKHPAIMAELAKIQASARERTEYGLEQAVAELDDIIKQSRELEQMGPAVKALEQKNKLLGLLKDRVEIESNVPNITLVLAEAQARVLPIRSPELVHDAQFRDISGACDATSTDKQSGVTTPTALPAPEKRG